LQAAYDLLQLLGAVDAQRRLTPLGRAMAELPLHPRLARLLLAARTDGQTALGCELVALLSERDLCPPDWQPAHPSACDLLERLDRLRRGHGEAGRLAAVRRAAAFWRQRCTVGAEGTASDAQEINRLLALAFPDRIGGRRAGASDRYLLASGRGARLGPRSAVPCPGLLVAAELRGAAAGDAEITLAGSLEQSDLEALFADRLGWRHEVCWDDSAGRVVGREVRGLGALVLQERPVPVGDAEAVPLLADLVRREGLTALAWPPSAVQYRGRLALLHRFCPADDWPDVGDQALLERLDQWLTPCLGGMRNRGDLVRFDPAVALRSWLGRRAGEVERLAPERLAVPGGSTIRLDYAAGERPVLAVKLQELFGLGDSPRVVAGRVPVLIHLLSPAGRPLAVTADLRSFWDTVYPDVRREMRGRYPKHPWPEDPWRAEATRRTKPH